MFYQVPVFSNHVNEFFRFSELFNIHNYLCSFSVHIFVLLILLHSQKIYIILGFLQVLVFSNCFIHYKNIHPYLSFFLLLKIDNYSLLFWFLFVLFHTKHHYFCLLITSFLSVILNLEFLGNMYISFHTLLLASISTLPYQTLVSFPKTSVFQKN